MLLRQPRCSQGAHVDARPLQVMSFFNPQNPQIIRAQSSFLFGMFNRVGCLEPRTEYTRMPETFKILMILKYVDESHADKTECLQISQSSVI